MTERQNERPGFWEAMFAIIWGFFRLLVIAVVAWWQWAGRRTSTPGKVLAYGGPIILVMVLVAAAAGAAGSSNSDGGDFDSGEAVSTTRPGTTPGLVDVVAPRFTQLPLAATATPEATPLPGLTAQECAYLNEVLSEYLDPVGASIADFTDLSLQAVSDPALFFDDEWKIRMASQFAIWSVSNQRFALLAAPPSLSGFHARFQEALSSLDSAGGLAAQGIDSLDAATIDQATARITAATSSLEEANDLLTTSRDDRVGQC